MKYGKLLIQTELNLEGKTLICISAKYGNFKLDKEYPVTVPSRYLDGRPGSFQITDDDHDSYTIGKGDIGKIFEIRKG